MNSASTSAAAEASTRERRRANCTCLANALASTVPSSFAQAVSSLKSTAPPSKTCFDLYLHGFFVTDDGKWTVVQQGMNGDNKQARRYHWHSEDLKSFVDEPHSAIDGPAQGEIVNLTDHRAERSRAAQLELLSELGPDRIVSELAAIDGKQPAQAMLPHLVMPAHHDVRSSDVFSHRLHGTLAAAAERGPVDFPELLLTPGVGLRTVRSLAMVAEV